LGGTLARDLNTRYGTEAELRLLCAELSAAGVRPMADIVINHRCADTQDADGNWQGVRLLAVVT
jgi:alpha-amylase